MVPRKVGAEKSLAILLSLLKSHLATHKTLLNTLDRRMEPCQRRMSS